MILQSFANSLSVGAFSCHTYKDKFVDSKFIKDNNLIPLRAFPSSVQNMPSHDLPLSDLKKVLH